MAGTSDRSGRIRGEFAGRRRHTPHRRSSPLIAATSRHNLRRTRLGTAGALGLIILDTAMLTAALIIAPAPAWPMAVAIPLSLTRITLTLRSLPTAFAH
ncbi:MAG: hypothetical protein ACRDOO_11110 [Actinomadura sp.]